MAIDYGDMFSRYASARMDRAMQPFEDPEGYMNNRLGQQYGVDMNGNTRPLSTTITYNDDGTQTVTNKREIGPAETAQPTAAPAIQAAPIYQAPVAQPVQQPQPMMAAQPVAPAPAVNPAAQDIEEQRRRQLEQAQLAQAQAQATQVQPQPQPAAPEPAPQPVIQQAAPAPAPAPVAPAAPAPAPVAQAPSAPINPAAPMPNIAPLPQPGPGVQVAGPAQLPPAAPKPQWQTDLDTAQGDATKLAAFVGNPNNPEEARKIASEKWQQLLTQAKEEEKGNKILMAAAQGDPKATNDLARHLKSRTEEGSYLKAILFARLGLTDLAKEEQAKLSVGGLESTMLGGTHYTVERNRAGGITRAWDAEGNSVGDKDIAKLNAEALTTKGIETGKTLYKTPDGSVYSFSTMPGRPGGVWTNMTSGVVSQTAPKGVTPFGQQDPAVIRGLQLKAAAEKQARLDNDRAGGTRYSEEQIRQLGNEAFRSFTGYNFSPRIAEAASEAASTGYVAPPAGPRPEVGAVEQAQASQAGVALSPTLQAKVISAQRSWDEQNRLYQQSVAAGTPGTLPNGNPVAKPGTSAHEAGGALDIKGTLTRAEREELFDKGYYQPLANDPNHWELRNKPAAARPAAPATTADANARVRAQLDSQAQAIANYESKPLSAGGAQGVYNQAVMARVRELNPTYDDTKYASVNKARQAFTTGKQGDVVRTMNTAVDHLDTLQSAANALGNGQLPIFNKIAQEYQRNVGGPAITDFNGIKTIVGSEVAKAVAGGATALGDREEIRKEIDAANSPQQLAGVIKRYQELLGGQLKGLRTQYEDAGLKDFDRKLTDRTRKVLKGEQGGATTRSNW